MTRFDIGDHLVTEPDLVQPPGGGEDQLRPPVRRIRTALDVPKLLELVDEPSDDLLVTATERRQLGCPDSVLVEIGEHGAMARLQVAIAGLGEPLEELILQGEEQAARQHAEVWVPLLPLATSTGGSHGL